MNKKLDITSACCTLYICDKISVRKSLVDISHIQLFWFPFIVAYKQNINLTEIFHLKPSVQGFHFCHPQVLELFTAGFSTRTFAFPPVHWLKKSDYSSVLLTPIDVVGVIFAI